MLCVAPFAGAWIEIEIVRDEILAGPVAPFAGAWIEIYLGLEYIALYDTSHPSRVRGLKSINTTSIWNTVNVAPFAGAWIEI